MNRATNSRRAAPKANGTQTRKSRPTRLDRLPDPNGTNWNLRLYIAGQTPKSIAAFANLRRICEEHLKGRYSIEIIDLLKNPQLAQGDQILAIPTLVRKVPTPIKKVIGDLSDAERFLVGFDLKPRN